jgi:hypothetical protein
MTMEEKQKLLELIYSSIPYSSQIKDLDLIKSDNAVYFTWRGDRFKVSTGMFVEQIHGDISAGSNLSILLESLIKRSYIDKP